MANSVGAVEWERGGGAALESGIFEGMPADERAGEIASGGKGGGEDTGFRFTLAEACLALSVVAGLLMEALRFCSSPPTDAKGRPLPSPGLHVVSGTPVRVTTMQAQSRITATVDDGSGGSIPLLIEVPGRAYAIVPDARTGNPRITGSVGVGKHARNFGDVPPFTSLGEAIRAENVVLHVDGATAVEIDGR